MIPDAECLRVISEILTDLDMKKFVIKVITAKLCSSHDVKYVPTIATERLAFILLG